MAGSLLMLAGDRRLRPARSGTFDLVQTPASTSRWLFLGFMLAFAIKAPLFPFHGWLPDAYRESPPEVTRGALRRDREGGHVRDAADRDHEVPGAGAATTGRSILALGAAALVYGSLLAFRAPDFRGVVAYSSMAQSGLITLGLFSGTDLGFDGAVLQMVAHGLVSASLFLVAGAVERRTTTGEFALLGGMATRPARRSRRS